MGKMRLQFWSFDIVFAVIVFSAALAVLVYEWSSIESQLSLGAINTQETMQLQAQAVSRSIFTVGWPADWEGVVNVSNSLTWQGVSVGIGTGNGTRIAPGKLAALISMVQTNYQATKQPLGLSYDYYIRISSPYINLSIGRDPAPSKAATVYSAQADGYINTDPVIVTLLVWSNTIYGGS